MQTLKCFCCNSHDLKRYRLCNLTILIIFICLFNMLSFVHLGILEVLYCVLIESPEVLNIIQENHIKSIISLLDKHGRNHKVGSFSVPLLAFV